MTNFIEEHKTINVGNSSHITLYDDLFAGLSTTEVLSDVVCMKDWREITFIIHKGAGAVGAAVITVDACDDADASNHSQIAFRYRACETGDTWGAWTEVALADAATGFTTAAAADNMYEIHVRSAELYSDYEYVRLEMDESVNTAVSGGLIAILTSPRHARSVGRTVLT